MSRSAKADICVCEFSDKISRTCLRRFVDLLISLYQPTHVGRSFFPLGFALRSSTLFSSCLSHASCYDWSFRQTILLDHLLRASVILLKLHCLSFYSVFFIQESTYTLSLSSIIMSLCESCLLYIYLWNGNYVILTVRITKDITFVLLEWHTFGATFVFDRHF